MTTIARLAIFGKDGESYGLGIDICRDKQAYAILSVYLPKEQYPSKRSVLPRAIEEAFKLIPDNENEVVFISTLRHFQNHRYLERKAGVFSTIPTKFRRVKTSPYNALKLAIDAVEPGRRSTIIEVL
jgi:hypothetical protein